MDGIVHVGCLAHARRKFDEALNAQKATGRGGLAAEGLALIQRQRCPRPTFRLIAVGGLMPSHERSI